MVCIVYGVNIAQVRTLSETQKQCFHKDGVSFLMFALRRECECFVGPQHLTFLSSFQSDQPAKSSNTEREVIIDWCRCQTTGFQGSCWVNGHPVLRRNALGRPLSSTRIRIICTVAWPADQSFTQKPKGYFSCCGSWELSSAQAEKLAGWFWSAQRHDRRKGEC